MLLRIALHSKRQICLVVLAIAAGLASEVCAEELTGQQIYQQQCASCHGDQGQGTKDGYSDALIGDRPLVDLKRVIEETMPEGSPEDCVGEDAEKVAAYIYDAFYSEIAQARNRPARIELSRLTARQYQNAVTDLLGSFGGNAQWNDERGLKAEYFNSRRPRGDKRVLERADSAVDFSFGDGSPDEKIGKEEFAIRWEGSVLAPNTGDYEFVLETENGARLWVNDRERPLIDAGVKSGDQKEFSESIRLLGGRFYPIRLEFFKFKEPSASIRLKWKPPHQAMEVVPQRNLSPKSASEVFVVQTPFPPDDSSIGYERGIAVSKEWDQATTSAAIEVAGHVAKNISRLAGTKDDAGDRKEKLQQFATKLIERAFRRPLSDEQKEFFVDRHFKDADDPVVGVKKVVLLTLKSPRFLYLETGFDRLDHYDAASWLSFGLWDSLPDQRLLDAARQNKLQTREEIHRQAQRMVKDFRTRSKVRQFLHQWLKLDHFHNLSKDHEAYPGFDEQMASDLRTSLDLFLDEVVWSEASDFRQLLSADYVYLNERLAGFYGVDGIKGEQFQKVPLNPEQRAGIISHPYLLSGFAYHAETSPIHRGVFLARSLLGRRLKPPPVAVAPLAPDLHADLTTRQRVAMQTQAASCKTCHEMINPLGFALEGFDAVGRLRSQDRGKPIDATGFYLTQTGEQAKFNGVKELASFLAGSPETHEAFVEQLYTYLLKQPIQAFGAEQLPALKKSFAENQFNIQKLLAESITAAAVSAQTIKSDASSVANN